MVGANTFREPALTAKMATTLDHISNGRAILGIGGAWFEEEHIAFGIPFGSGFPERLRWLGEALPIMRGMLHGERPTAAGPRYAAKARPQRPAADPGSACRCSIGGGGEQVTLKLVARYARREQRRRRDRERPAQGGDPAPALRDGRARPGRDRADDRPRDRHHPRLARRGRARPRRDLRAQRQRRPWKDQPVGTPEDVAERLQPFLELGYRHLIARLPVAVRRGVDDAPRDRGQADPRAD